MKFRSKFAAAAAATALTFAAYGVAFAAGPGNNGLDETGNGHTSDATVGSSLSAAGDSASMGQDAVMECDSNNVGTVSGSFTLLKTLDVGSVITVYLVPNNGSNADPSGNVSKNETMVTLTGANNTSGSVIDWSISVTSAFSVSQGGILGVFAVNADDSTAISSSKTNSLNCSDASTTSESSTTTFTGSVSDSSTTESTTESTSFTGSVSEASDVPSVPNTATVGDSGSSSGNGSWLLVAVLGALAGSVLVLTPARAKNKR